MINYLIQPMWEGDPTLTRSIFCKPNSVPRLAWGIGVHDQMLDPSTSIHHTEWVKTFHGKQKTKQFIEDADDNVNSITINLGWHLYPHLDYKTGNELLKLSEVFKDCKNYDKVRWRFANGWDLHNLNEELRYNWFKTQLKYIAEENIVMDLSSIEMVQYYKQKFPKATISWAPIYFQRMINHNFEYEFKPNNNVRSKHAICLNNYNKWHRTRIVEHLVRDNNYAPQIHYSYISPPPHLKSKVLGCNHDNVSSLTMENIGAWQDTPPYELFNDAYIYIATETYYSPKEIIGNLRDCQYLQEYVDAVPTSNTCYQTEKTLKGYMFRLPMLVVGMAGTLKGFKDAGFESFPEFFDESYDDIDDAQERMDCIFKNIDNIMNNSILNLHTLYNSEEIQQKLNHNEQLFYKYCKDSPINKYNVAIAQGDDEYLTPFLKKIYND